MLLPSDLITEENGIEKLMRLRDFFPREKVLYRPLQMPGSFQKPTKASEVGYRFQAKSDKMWKTKRGVDVIAPVAFYVDARDVVDRLDKVVGPHNWQLRHEKFVDGAIAHIGIKINGEWIWKSDGADNTDIEGFKGALSKAIVRCGSTGWGIGRYFYDLKLNFPVHNPSDDGKRWYFNEKWNGDKWDDPTSIIPDEYLPE